MEELSAAIEKAEKIVVYAEGEARAYLPQDAAFAALMQAWEETVSAAVRMPAFGVSIDALTRKGLESGLWMEFCFGEEHLCGAMPFESLLLEVKRDWHGFNIVRGQGGRYEGRCFYVDLRQATMQPLYDALQKIARG